MPSTPRKKRPAARKKSRRSTSRPQASTPASAPQPTSPPPPASNPEPEPTTPVEQALPVEAHATAVLRTEPLEAVEATSSTNGHDEPAEALDPGPSPATPQTQVDHGHGPRSGSRSTSIVELCMRDPAFRTKVIKLLIDKMS